MLITSQTGYNNNTNVSAKGKKKKSRIYCYFIKEFLSLREKSAHIPSVTKEMLNYISELPITLGTCVYGTGRT